ncbi:hypothetical protein HDV05_006814 [Chytridiales sp. JEL 0842]|nr:hypothetical protein HDV05_006814 [Chytridiales sp. JEL 0842]
MSKVNETSIDYAAGEALGIQEIFFYGIIMGCTSQCLMQTSFLRGKGIKNIRILIYVGLLITFLISMIRSVFLITSGTQGVVFKYFDLAVDYIYLFARIIAFYAAYVRFNAFLGPNYSTLKFAVMVIIGLVIWATRVVDRSIGFYLIGNPTHPQKDMLKALRLDLKLTSIWLFCSTVFLMNITLVYFIFQHVRRMTSKSNKKALHRIQEVLVAVGVELLMLIYLGFDTSTDMLELPNVINLAGTTDVTIAIILCNLFRFGASIRSILNGYTDSGRSQHGDESDFSESTTAKGKSQNASRLAMA